MMIADMIQRPPEPHPDGYFLTPDSSPEFVCDTTTGQVTFANGRLPAAFTGTFKVEEWRNGNVVAETGTKVISIGGDPFSSIRIRHEK